MDLRYNPDDQFFQAFKAGWRFAESPQEPLDEFTDRAVWGLYLAWILEAGAA